MDDEEVRALREEAAPPGAIHEVQRQDPESADFQSDPTKAMGRGEAGPSTEQPDRDGESAYPGGDEDSHTGDETSMELEADK